MSHYNYDLKTNFKKYFSSINYFYSKYKKIQIYRIEIHIYKYIFKICNLEDMQQT